MKKNMFFAFALGLGVVGSSCSDDSAEESSSISGTAVKGYVASAKVDVYQYLETGQRGKLLASTTTDSKGSYSVSVNYRGAVEIIVREGAYIDEATGNTVSLENDTLRSVVAVDQKTEVAAVTTLTTVAAAHVDAHAAAGIQTAITNANAEVSEAFGLSGIDLSAVIPSDFSFTAKGHSVAQLKYGAIQAGLSQLIKDNTLSAENVLTLVKEISSDFADGSFDGKSGSIALSMSLTITPEEALAGLNTAIENFMNSSSNKSGVSSSSFSVTVPQPM